jgi:hypothetical protein
MNTLPSKRRKVAPGSKKSSKAWTRLQNLRSHSIQQPFDKLIPNRLYSESGFKDVRTNAEKERLLQWVFTSIA